VIVRRLVIGLVVIGCLALLVLAAQLADTGGDTEFSADSPSFERLIPQRGTEILRQDDVGIDLAPGFTAALVVNGIEIPADQTAVRQGVDEYLYKGGEDGIVPFVAGQNCVTALIWPVDQTRESARDVSWCFNVT
jgi:hypothetical protein